MISDIESSMPEDPLANEANLIAMLDLSDSNPVPAVEVDPELAAQTLLDDPNLSQLLLRRNEENGESITAYFRLKVLAGQQRVSWHVPVSPAFLTAPTCTSEAVDGSDARVRFTNIQKFGVRAELIVPEPSDRDRTILVMVGLASN
jgi:hypothetical protein